VRDTWRATHSTSASHDSLSRVLPGSTSDPVAAIDSDTVTQTLESSKGRRFIGPFFDASTSSLDLDGFSCLWLFPNDHEPWFRRPPSSINGPPGWEKWKLDVPDVPTLDYEQLQSLDSVSNEKRRDMCQAVDWCTNAESFRSRLRPDWKFPTTERRSTDFESAQEELKRDKYISPIDQRDIKCAIKAFSVPKIKKKTRRAILDARPVNEGMKEVPHVKLPSQEDIDECVRTYQYFVELDGKGWFHQFDLSPEIRAYFTIRLGKRSYRWHRMPMGWAYSVWIAQKTSEFLADFSLPNGVRIIVYIDNIYIFGNEKENINAAVKLFLERCQKVNAQFSITTPLTQVGIVLGMQVDLNSKTVKLPEDFVMKIKKAQINLDGLFDNASVHTRLLWKLFGCLQWGARVQHSHMYKYPRYTAWLSHRARQLQMDPALWDRGCRIWPKALSDLHRLCVDICENIPRIVTKPSDQKHTVFTDASNVGYGVVHEKTGRSFGKRWTVDMTRHCIAIKELYGAVRGIIDTVNCYPDTKHVHLVIDNTNVVSWITKRRAACFFGNRLLKDLFEALGHRTISTEWIPSADNPADAPSRTPWNFGDGMSEPDRSDFDRGLIARCSTKQVQRHATSSKDAGRFHGLGVHLVPTDIKNVLA